MVTDAILSFLLALCQGIWSLIPPWNMVTDTTAIYNARQLWYAFDAWAPVTEVVWVISLVMLTWLAVMGFKWIMQIIKLIRGAG